MIWGQLAVLGLAVGIFLATLRLGKAPPTDPGATRVTGKRRARGWTWRRGR